MTGASIILLNNVKLETIPETLLTLGMATLGVSSLSVQAKDKLKQKENKTKHTSYEKPQPKEEIEEKELTKDKVKQPTIEELKELRNLLTNTSKEQEKPKTYTKKDFR